MAFEKKVWLGGDTVTAAHLNRIENGIAEALGSGGSGALPTITSADNGKVMVAKNGEWTNLGLLEFAQAYSVLPETEVVISHQGSETLYPVDFNSIMNDNIDPSTMEYTATHNGIDYKLEIIFDTANMDFRMYYPADWQARNLEQPEINIVYSIDATDFKAKVLNLPAADSHRLAIRAGGGTTILEDFMPVAIKAGEGGLSIAEGRQTTASGYASHAEGVNTVANHTSQHVFGEYNVADPSTKDSSSRGSYIEIVGNGTVSARSNARTLDWNGNEVLAGKLTVGTAPTADMDVATKKYVDDHAGGGSGLTNLVNGGSVGSVRGIETASGYTMGGGAFAEGGGTTASGDNSHAEGGGTTASGAQSHAEGTGATASGQGSHAEGLGAIASGAGSHAEGTSTHAKGECSHAEGSNTEAEGNHSHAEGNGTTASGAHSHAEGNNTTAKGQCSHAEGNGAVANGDHSHAEGYGTTASGAHSHAEGYKTTATHASQHVFGEYNVSDPTIDEAFARGTYVEIVGNGTASVKSNARTLDWNGNEVLAGKLTVGTAPTADMDVATKKYVDDNAGGGSSVVVAGKGVGSTVQGLMTNVASGDYSHVEGGFYTEDDGDGYELFDPNQATGASSHAEGRRTVASKEASHAEGSRTIASGASSHAEGSSTTASGTASHAEGLGTTASNYYSHAEGDQTTASNTASHAEGFGTTASGQAAHAEGIDTIASGSQSHAEGNGTISNHAYQHVFGEYNVADPSTAVSNERGTYVEIVGNGTSSAKSNARTLDWSGNEVLAGSLTLGKGTADEVTITPVQLKQLIAMLSA